MRRRPVYIAVLAIAAIALMLAVLTLYAGSRKAPAARSAASAPADVEQTLSPLAAGKNCAVFAAYSADGTVSDYVIDYLRALKEIAPNIVYVTDNPHTRKRNRQTPSVCQSPDSPPPRRI